MSTRYEQYARVVLIVLVLVLVLVLILVVKGTRMPDAHPSRTVEAVALAIRDPAGSGRILTVRRPPDDPDLPDAWGLPAASLRDAESAADAAHRAARDKLGVALELGAEINRGTVQRGDTILSMRLFAARVRAGQPHVPQPVPGVTQYTALRWDTSDALRPAARRGSLCCRLALEPGPPRDARRVGWDALGER